MKKLGIGDGNVRISFVQLTPHLLDQFCSRDGDNGETLRHRTPGRHRRRGSAVRDEEDHLVDRIERATTAAS